MKKLICKILTTFLLLGALTGVLTACKKEPETTTYSVAMGYKLVRSGRIIKFYIITII